MLASSAWPNASNASSGPDFTPCPGEPALSCADVPVPLDRSGAVPGTIALSVARKLAGSRPSGSALIALAGGPGQPALPFGEFTAKAMAAALPGRDLLVYDQRGTGSSDPLSCPALERFSRLSASRLFAACAEQIGPARGAFTTQETVRDIDAIRQVLGYERLVLYGTSYGTKVALEYAERFPQHTEALVLDSVVPSDGLEPFRISSFEAVPGVIRELCSGALCAGISSDPLGELTSLVARLRRHPLSGSVYDGSGRRHAAALDENGLFGTLFSGDLNPALRALLPAAVHSALHGYPDPMLRLQAIAEGLVPNLPSIATASGEEETDEALFATTSCEETPFPWQRSAAPATRRAEALAYLHAQPASDFAPFDAETSLAASLVGACEAWPYASAPPPVPAPLPAVPTLILSGAQDLRTPTANAERVAAQIPGAQLEVVPFTGHSVVGSDLTGCAAKALAAFFAGQPVAPCTGARDVLAPTLPAPRSVAATKPPKSLGGLPGRTLVAALDTLLDLNRQLVAATLQAGASLPSGASFGGLHGGFARFQAHSVVLSHLTLVPGVNLTGTFPIRRGQLATSTIRIAGPSGADGTIRFGSASRHVTGTLGGRRFDVSLASARARLSASASSWSAEWPAAAPLLSRLGRMGKLARRGRPAALAGLP